MISKGWNVARNNLSRNDLSCITLMIGAVYLTYSAYYVSINISGMKLFIGVTILAFIFLVNSQCFVFDHVFYCDQKCHGD